MTANEIVPFLAIRDMPESLAFYTDGLGFRIENTWKPDGEIKWCMLSLDGARLMLQEENPARRTEGKGRGVRQCIFCADAIELYRRFVANGIEPGEPYVGNGLWVTPVVDPDGYLIDFESPTDVAEETRLSEVEEA